MTSTAQVQANRSNAQKSTGPRTAEGKAVAAQNAVRHGLLAKEVVVKGEDPGEFECYRQQMLEELAPVGLMEETLAQRIVGLSWRLRRAERLQTAAFDKIEDPHEPLPVYPPEVASKMLAILAESNWHPPVPPARKFGRRAVQDFNQEQVLDRLLVYERRIEHSLYRTMAELRKLRKEGGVSSFRCEVGRLGGLDAGPSALDTSHFPLGASDEPPEGGTPSGGGDESCQTNPISGRVSSGKSEVASGLPTSHLPLETPDNPPEGGSPNKACETNPIGDGSSVGGIPNDAAAQAESRQTKPIDVGSPEGPVPGSAEVWSDLAPGEIRQTKPMQGPGSTPDNTPARPRRIRKFPNTVNEETYDSYLGRWVWTGYALANKDSNQADAGRRP